MLNNTNLFSEISKKSSLYVHWSLLKKSIDTQYENTPGYVYEDLVKLSYESRSLSEQLAKYYSEILSGNNTSSNLRYKTLKAVSHLTHKGSRHFRKALRDLDESLKDSSNIRIENDPIKGSTLDKEIISLAMSIREYLFSSKVMVEDDKENPEIAPNLLHNYSGLGSSGASDRKYHGFGNSPINKEYFGKQVLDIIEESFINNSKTETLEYCLSTCKGEYESVSVPQSKENSLNVIKETLESSSKIKKHVPGKAGGGWESSDDEEILVPEMIITKSEKKDNTESSIIIEYCNGNEEIPQSFDESSECLSKLKKENKIESHVEYLGKVLQSSNKPIVQLKALLLLEVLLMTNLIKPKSYDIIFTERLLNLANSDHDERFPVNIPLKAKKNYSIIKILLKSSSN